MRVGVAAAVAAFAAVAQPSFGPPTSVATFTTPTGHAELQDLGAADLNGDGITDVLAIRIRFEDPTPVPVGVYVGDGKGHFKDETSTIFEGPVPMTSYARRIVFGDFNGDGRTDVFIPDTGRDVGPSSFAPNTLILSAAGGKLVDASANLPRTPDYTHSGSAADVDHDGTVDLFAGNIAVPSGSHVPPEILLNDGSGHFRVSAGALPTDLDGFVHYDGGGFADVDGDGAPDLVLLGVGGVANRLLLNDGSGHFHDSPTPLPPKPWDGNSEGLTVTPIDLNGDRRVDLLLGYTKAVPYYQGSWIQVLINKGDGTFTDETATRLPQTDNNGEWPEKVEIADLNGDGKPDIGLSKWWYPFDTPSFWLNRGDGTFVPLASPVAALTQPTFVFLDANRDGRVDIYSASAAALEVHTVSLQFAPKPKKPKATPKCKRRPKPRACK